MVRLLSLRSLYSPETLGKLKQLNDLIGTRTRNLPARSIVLQPATLPRGPIGGVSPRILDFRERLYLLPDCFNTLEK
jgi:hypothetical protein